MYESVVAKKRDVRVQQYEPRHLHALLAFTPWQQAATEELKVIAETDPTAPAVFKEYLQDLSKELLGWIDAWRQPRPGAASGASKGAKA